MQHLLFCHENSVFKVDLGVPVPGLSELSNDHLKPPTDFKFRSGLCTECFSAYLNLSNDHHLYRQYIPLLSHENSDLKEGLVSAVGAPMPGPS